MTKQYHPDKDHIFFLYAPEGEGLVFFSTEEERDAFARDEINTYYDDGWLEDVTSVCSGIVTHSAQECERRDRPPPEELDEDNVDIEGFCWDEDCDYRCNYHMEPLS